MKADRYFYLGKSFSPETGSLSDQEFLYKPDDLTTHGVVFGMTGSGKTGLCIDLLEEVIESGIPVTIVDPKGDVTNLALIFPELSAEEFKPWVSAVEARKGGKSLEEYAAEVAARWQKGLEEWGIPRQKIRSLKDKIDIRIFTPGSSAGLPVNIVQGFHKPAGDFRADEEGMVEKIGNTVSALLSLLGIDSDPLKSKPHILISNIIQHFWRLDRSISLEDLIINIQKPPIKKLGVFDLNSVIGEKERIELAFQLNNIIAAPGFRFWTSGLPLSVENLQTRPEGKVPVNIFYIAHLPDNERMFFVSLLLNEMVYWIRRQKGSPELKYLFYMDEVYGYLPPYPRNPPSKNPLMILLKQARAFGLGVVLVTQNPKDIDYKALANAGTWFLGKLQAEGDRERVLEGLRGILDASGESPDMADLKDRLSSLAKRVFMVKNVHRPGIQTFQTRWAISYLAGPLTREQIKTLSGDREPARPAETPSDLLPFAPPAGISLEYLFESGAAEGQGHYVPHLYLEGEMIFDDSRLGIYVRKKYTAAAPLAAAIDWRGAQITDTAPEYAPKAGQTLGYKPLGLELNYSSLNKFQADFKNHLFAHLTLNLFTNRGLNLVSEADETEEAFRQRCRDVVEKMIDKEVDRLKDRYDRQIKRVENSLERERLRIKQLEGEHKSKQVEEAIAIGESVLGLLLGSRSTRRLSAAARRRRTTASAASRVGMGKTKLSQLEEKLLLLREELEDRVAEIEDKYYEKADQIENLDIRLEKEDIIVSRQALLWKWSG